MQIHRYRNLGYAIILDVESGSVHIADDVLYDAAGALDGLLRDGALSLADFREGADVPPEMRDALVPAYPGEAVREACADLRELIADGTLFYDDAYRPAMEEFEKRETVVKALCLHVAHDCNLRCRYCFADEGEYHGKRELMTAEVGKRALEFLVASSGNRRNLEVDFFGGEPLMNFGVVKELTAYGRQLEKESGKHFRFTLTTNGVLIRDEFIDFANRELDNVVLSMDGRKEVHDGMRPFPNGSGSYETVIPRFRAFVKARGEKEYYLRGTYTRHNLDFSKDVLHMADLGFDRLSVEPAVTPEETDWSIRKEDIPALLAQYDILAEEMLRREKEGRPFTFFHFMIDLTGGPCVYKRLSGCGSGTEYLAVTPAGDLYPCHQFVGEEEYRLGSVFDGIERTDLVREFKKVNVYAKEDCRNCFARYYCSGGCAANGVHFTGSLTGTDEIGCALMRKRVECAIALRAARAAEADA